MNRICTVLVNEISIKEVILNTELEYLNLAPSSQELIGAEIELVTAIGREVRLRRLTKFHMILL